MTDAARNVLAGVTVPLVTVMDDTGRPDAMGATELIRAMAAAGVHSLMLLGSNGEGALLPADTTTEYLRDVIALWREERTGGRVIVNVSAQGTSEMLRRAELAAEALPDALVVSPPGYFHHRPDEIERHIRSVEALGLPYAVYNIPKYANPLPLDVYRSLLDSSNFVGVKDSSGDAETLRSLIDASSGHPGIAVSQGAETALVAGLDAGAAGIVPGIGNIAPRVAVDLYDGHRAGDRIAADAAQERITALTGIHAVRPGVPTVKAILHDRGVIASRRCAPPLAEGSETETLALREVVAPYAVHLLGTSHA